MKELIKNALILCAITLVAGLLLGFIYEVTKQPRAIQAEKSRQKAFEAVFSEADSFEDYKLDEESVIDTLKKNNITQEMVSVNEVVAALDSEGNAAGYVITVTTHEGYSGDITFTVGIKNDGTVNGYSVLAIKETPGLGMKAQDDEFKNQYANKNVDSFVYTKNGATQDNEIDVISGATITTNAMTNGVNAAIYCFDYITGGDSIE